MTYYLKYRPQKIAELDLDSVRDQLLKIVSSNHIPHAFLFSGSRGAGKTSTARILAKAVNCEQAKLGEPCNECAQCLAITRGNSLDVVEIDAASNRGVDDIRSLRETVRLSPIEGKKKVYIIDEAHMLTTEAANALLKTLEEPPVHAMFILATTAPEKLLDTIRSRCTMINFHKGQEAEIERALKKAIDGEKLKIDPLAVLAIANSVDGSFREAHKILEQLSYLGKNITVEDVNALSSTQIADPTKLISLLAKKEAKEALSEIEMRVNQGVNIKTYLTQIVSILRKSLLAKMGTGDSAMVGGLAPNATEGLDIPDLQKLIELFSEAARFYPTALIPQLPLELVVVKWCAIESEKLPVRQTQGGQVKSQKKVTVEVFQTETKNPAARTETSIPSEKEGKAKAVGSIVSDAELENLWPQIMRLTKEKNHSVEALLRAAKPLAYDGKALQIEVFYKFHKERLEKEPYRTIIEEIVGGLLGGKPRMVCILAEGKKRAADIMNVTTPEDQDLAQVAEDIFNAPTDGKVH